MGFWPVWEFCGRDSTTPWSPISKIFGDFFLYFFLIKCTLHWYGFLWQFETSQIKQKVLLGPPFVLPQATSLSREDSCHQPDSCPRLPPPCRVRSIYVQDGRVNIYVHMCVCLCLCLMYGGDGIRGRSFCLLHSFVFFPPRKISPELTTASPPLFAEEDWPWASIHSRLPLLYTWDTYHSMAFAEQCHVHTRDPNRQTPGHQEAERAHLTSTLLGRPLFVVFRKIGTTQRLYSLIQIYLLQFGQKYNRKDGNSKLLSDERYWSLNKWHHVPVFLEKCFLGWRQLNPWEATQAFSFSFFIFKSFFLGECCFCWQNWRLIAFRALRFFLMCYDLLGSPALCKSGGCISVVKIL